MAGTSLGRLCGTLLRRRRVGRAAVIRACLALAIGALVWSPACAAGAADYELRLVPYDEPNTTIEQRVRKQSATWGHYYWTLTAAQRHDYVPPYACWARNILLDGKRVFEVYERGRYIGRFPIARRKLAPGKHTITPGNHVFTVAADGRVATDDPDLLVGTSKPDGRSGKGAALHVIRIRCYPVTIRATNADPKAREATSLLERIPLPDLALREAGGGARELLPQIRRFLWLTAWVPANTAGRGYVVYPLRHTFHLGAGGVVPGAGGGQRMPIWRVENKYEIVIPTTRVPATGEPGTQALITGHQKLSFRSLGRGEGTGVLRYGSADLYSRKEPYELRISEGGPGLLIDGDLSRLPSKMIRLGWYGPDKRRQRALVVETQTRHMKIGQVFRARVRSLGPTGAGAARGVFAQLQAYKSYKWRELSFKPGPDDTIEVSLPKVTSGVYKLRLGVRMAGAAQDEFCADQWVTVAARAGGGIGVFTQRGRTAFYRGERFWLGLGVVASGQPVPAGTDVTVDLVDLAPGRGPARGARIPLYRAKTEKEIRDRHTFILDIEPVTSQALAPGHYIVDARVAGRSGPPLHLEIVDPAPRTHFTNLLNGKYNTLGGLYGQALRGGVDADELARAIVECGYNAFMGMSYGMNRVSWPGRNFIADLVRERPEMGPWEAYAPPSGRDQFLNAAVRHNLRFYENLFTQHDSIMPRGDIMLDACRRYTALEAQSMRHSPVFKGVCLYDELDQALDHDSSMAIMAYFRRADELNYRRKYKGRTSSEALQARDRFFGRPQGQRDYKDIEIFRTWPKHLEEQWEDFSTRMSGAVKAVMPEAQNYTYARMSALPGTILSGAPAARESVFRPLEVASAVGYKDMGGFGEFPTAGPLGADALRTRDGLLVWPMLFGKGTGAYSDSTLRQTFFTLSQKADGIAFMEFHATPKAKLNDCFNGLRDITALTTRYGDLLLAAEKGYKQVAIYYSREMERVCGGGLACEGLWTACIRAGFPADFLTDNQIRADKGLEYALIFVPGFTIRDAIPPETIAALRRLKAAGRKIIVERGSRLDIEGIERVDLDLYEIAGGETFPKHLDHDDERWWDRTEKLTRSVRKFLAERVPPAAEHDLVVGPDWLRCRKAHYMILPNLARTGFRGNHKTLYQAPDSPTLRFPQRPPACYDILEMKRVETSTTDGWTTLTADMRHYPGKIYAFLPAAIESIVLRAAASISAGANLSYEVFVADARNKMIDAGIPLEITITAPSGQVLQQVYRAGAPAYRGAYVVPVNIGAGSLKLRARELISGRIVEAAIALGPGTIRPARLDARKVRITDAGRIGRFMAEDVKVAEPLFAEKDLLNPGQLAVRLRRGKGALEKHLKSLFAAETLKLVEAHRLSREPSPELVKALVAELNKVITLGEPIYTDERFPPGKLSIATGRLGQESRKIKDKGKLSDINRKLLEEWYPDEFIPRPAVHIAVEEEWVRPQAERLRKALKAMGLRVRAEPMQPYVRGPGPLWRKKEKAGDLILDGSRLWRGEVVQPGVFLDAPVILLGRRRGMVSRLVDRDALAEPVSQNFPGPGKAILTWVHKAFSNHFDTVAVLATDEAGLSAGVDALMDIAALRASARPAHPIVAEPKFQTIASPKVFSDRRRGASSFRDVLRFEDRIETVQIDPKTGRILVGTNGFGHNIFCFSRDGKLLWKNFLPEHDVYLARWYDGGKRVLAATGQGFYVFLIDGDSGKVFRKFASTEWPDFHVNEREIKTRIYVTLNPPMRQMLILGRTGVLAVDYGGKKMWFYDRAWDIVDYPPKSVQQQYATFGQYLRLSAVAPSPDGTKVAYNEFRYFASTYGMGRSIVPLWRNEPQILDAGTGRILLKCLTDPGSNDLWKITWPAGSAHPWIHARNLSAPLLPRNKPGDKGVDPGKLGRFVRPSSPPLKIGGRLKKDSYSAARVGPTGRVVWHTRGKTIWVVGLDRLNAPQTRLYRSSREGLVRCIDLKTGRTIWQHRLPCTARLWLTGEDNLLAGTRNGILVRFDAGGKVLWRKPLRNLHEVPAKDYAKYILRAKQGDRDDTRLFYPVFDDRPDDYKGVLRMGLQQLDNGEFETAQGWTARRGRVRLAAPAHKGAKSLHLADGQLVTCRVQRKVIPAATYLLEFFYRTESFETKLAAGAHMSGGKDVFTISNFSARPGEWTFGRVAVKARAGTTAIDVGFEAGGGAVRVDTVLLRPVRFPSANLLADPELHKVTVTHPVDHRILYNRIPNSLRQNLLTRNNVTAFLQATPLGALIFTQEQAFLHNGVLDDVGPMWCYRPDPIGFGVVLTKPAYVSHLVLYLNNSAPSRVYQNIAILANDMKAKVPRTVGFVRGNKRRFIVVHFPKTLFTDNLKILPGKYRTQTDSITEIEVYGPVGGPETLTRKRFSPDPLATPMFMGTPSHVRSRLPDDLVGRYRVASRQASWGRAPALHAGVTVVDGVMTCGRATGTFAAVPVAAKPGARGRGSGDTRGQGSWRIGTVTPLTTPARYARRLLAGSADYKMHAVADNGAHIWAFKTGGRVYSSPVPDANEVYFGSDDGHLYKVDVDSGILIWEFKTGGRIRSGPALDGRRVYAASWDGLLHAVDKVRGTQVWKAKIAPYSSSSPAVHEGRVYIGDEEGTLHCFDAKTGRAVWRRPVGGRITMCPIVVPEGVFVSAEGGTAALVGPGGKIIWKRRVLPRRSGRRMPPRLTGQPFATKTQVVLTSTHGVLVLRRADGRRDTRFKAPTSRGYFVSAVPYGSRLCLVTNETHLDGRWGRYVVVHRSMAVVWAP